MHKDHLTEHAATIGDAPALIDDRPGEAPRRLDFAQLESLTNRLADGLMRRGVTPGENVAWWGANSLEVMVATHAVRKAGAISVPIPYRSTPDEAGYLLSHADVRTLLVDAVHLDTLAATGLALDRVVVFGGDPGPHAAWDDYLGDDVTRTPEHLATRLMIYTSGTTGRPKGALRQIGGAANQFGALLELLGWRDMPVTFLTTGPLYHSGPSGFALRAQLVGGAVVTQYHFDPEDWLRLVATHRVTATFSAPTPVRRLCALPAEVKARYDVTSLRCTVANAAPWTMTLKEDYLRDFPPDSLWEVYGSTELSVCTVLRPEDQLHKRGSCGQAAPGVEIELFDDQGVRITEPGVPGELYARSAGVFQTYHKDHEHFVRDHRDGFQTVGDIAYRDDDGYYFICDRKKDMIVTGGVNVYPAEIENVLDAHPLVEEVAVIGVPDQEWGEAVCAIVVPRGPLADTDVIAFARERVSGAKVPKRVVFLDELPKTGTGKVLKRELRGMVG